MDKGDAQALDGGIIQNNPVTQPIRLHCDCVVAKRKISTHLISNQSTWPITCPDYSSSNSGSNSRGSSAAVPPKNLMIPFA
eukprot:7920983-Pyramimonas_sp.AAC.2